MAEAFLVGGVRTPSDVTAALSGVCARTIVRLWF